MPAGWRSLASVTVLLLAGCGDPVSGDTFESVELTEMGRGPNGAVMGRATLSFDDGKYHWRHSDLDCHGSYEVDGDEIVAETRIPCASYGDPIRAKLDGDTLTWAGKAYRRAD